MRIFSAFDSSHKYRELADAQKEFGVGKVLMITKSKMHLIVWFIIPAGIVVCVGLLVLYIDMKYIKESIDHMIAAIIIFTMCLTLLIIWYNSYIYHHLVFMIVTPEKVDIYNQLWLTHRNVKSMFVQDISWVYIDKYGLWQSIVNNWNITIESEENPHTKVYFWPIAHPDETKKLVEDIIEKLLTQERKPLRRTRFPFKV